MEIRIIPNTLRGYMSSHDPKCDHHTHNIIMRTLIVVFIRLHKSNHPHPRKRSIISVHTGLLYQHQQQKHHNTTQLHFSFTIIITSRSMYVCAHILLHVCYLYTHTHNCMLYRFQTEKQQCCCHGASYQASHTSQSTFTIRYSLHNSRIPTNVVKVVSVKPSCIHQWEQCNMRKYHRLQYLTGSTLTSGSMDTSQFTL